MNNQILQIEEFIGFKLPNLYSEFLCSLGDDLYEIPNTSITMYPIIDLIERNNAYQVQDFEKNALLVGQDGDLGFYIKKDFGEKIFELGVGALGSLDMRLKGLDINDFMKKIKEDYTNDE